MVVIYVVICGIILIFFWNKIFEIFMLIIKSVFIFIVVIGGFLGVIMLLVIRNGIVCGVFLNEFGLGSVLIVVVVVKIEWLVE